MESNFRVSEGTWLTLLLGFNSSATLMNLSMKICTAGWKEVGFSELLPERTRKACRWFLRFHMVPTTAYQMPMYPRCESGPETMLGKLGGRASFSSHKQKLGRGVSPDAADAAMIFKYYQPESTFDCRQNESSAKCI